MSQSSPPRIGVIAILSVVLILVLVVVLAIVGSFVQPEGRSNIQSFKNPLDAVVPQIIDPALAMAQLGGLSANDIIDQAISQARPGTALATLVYGPSVEAQDGAGDLLLLGNRFIRQNDLARAKLVYEMAAVIATLSPNLSDTVRADILLQVGFGLIGIEASGPAKLCLDQVFLLATESNYLQAAYRSAVLTSLSEAYRALGLRNEAKQALELSAVPAELEALPETASVLPRGKFIPFPAEIQAAEAKRWQAAQAVGQQLVELGGQVRPEALLDLKAALLREDALKTQFLTTRLAAEPQLSNKVDLVQAQINWQSIKYRIARKGFGLSLVSEWESQEAQIRAELAASYALLYRFYADVIIAIPNVADIDRATEEVVRSQILAGLLGQYPDYPSEQLQLQLLQIVTRLIETQPGTSLRVSYVSIEGMVYYTLINEQQIEYQ